MHLWAAGDVLGLSPTKLLLSVVYSGSRMTNGAEGDAGEQMRNHGEERTCSKGSYGRLTLVTHHNARIIGKELQKRRVSLGGVRYDNSAVMVQIFNMRQDKNHFFKMKGYIGMAQIMKNKETGDISQLKHTKLWHHPYIFVLLIHTQIRIRQRHKDGVM